MKKHILIIGVLTLFFSCQKKEKEVLTAQQIIDKTIEKSGGERYRKSTKEFVFRKGAYKGTHHEGDYRLERIIKDSINTIIDVLDNNSFTRVVNEQQIVVPDSMITRLGDGVNSVHYFAYLPYGLNASAVNKKLIGETTIKGVPYYEMQVTFKKEGGGTDFDDEFMYWINKDKFTIDYLAYKYAVNGGGIRYREAYNVRTIKGIRFVDYNNYKTDDLTTPLENLDGLFENGNLKLLSKIELENVSVSLEEGCC